MFHSKCISIWKGDCPNCRSSKNKLKKKVSFYELYAIMSNKKNDTNEYNKYNESCCISKHNLQACKSPAYGALLFCLDCENVTWCNL